VVQWSFVAGGFERARSRDIYAALARIALAGLCRS
jgi:hypothetical protein